MPLEEPTIYQANGKLYLSAKDSIHELVGNGPTLKTIASARRRPPQTPLDILESLHNPRLLPGPDGSLRAVIQNKQFLYVKGEWTEQPNITKRPPGPDFIDFSLGGMPGFLVAGRMPFRFALKRDAVFLIHLFPSSNAAPVQIRVKLPKTEIPQFGRLTVGYNPLAVLEAPNHLLIFHPELPGVFRVPKNALESRLKEALPRK